MQEYATVIELRRSQTKKCICIMRLPRGLIFMQVDLFRERNTGSQPISVCNNDSRDCSESIFIAHIRFRMT